MASVKVGVVRGGISNEHEISLKTGESVLKNLPEKYSGHDIVLGKDGRWYFRDQPSFPEKIFNSVDVVFNALHGRYGEDGKVQQLFDVFNVPYTGSGAAASAVGMNKVLAKDIFVKAGLKVPRAEVISVAEDIEEEVKKIFNTMGPPWAVKPASSGSSLGVSMAHNFNDLVKAVRNAFDFGLTVIVEEYISGKEATCGVVEEFRGEEHYALPVIEIMPPARSVYFDYKSKYSGEAEEICPANFDAKTKNAIENMARAAHVAVGCRHYSRADFVVSPRGIYILEINTLPGLTTESLLPKAINAVGSSYSEFLDHVIGLALNKNKMLDV